MQNRQRFSYQTTAIGVTVLLSLVSCGHKTEQNLNSQGPLEVGIVVVQPQAIELPRELPGRTSAYKIADIRPQVGGIVVKRSFIEGSEVKAGQVLYQINPETYQASYDQAVAALAKARANQQAAELRANRYAELITINAISKQENDDAQATFQQAVADVAMAKAALETARINLAYSRVSSPVTGRIGKSAVTEGALVSAYQQTALATVQQLDPIYVDVTQSSRELMQLRSAVASGKLQGASEHADVRLKLEDGSEYREVGKLLFTDVTVDPSTGAILLRAIFPNPKRQLLPGMFVRTRLIEGKQANALMVPQQAVIRTPTGEATVLVLGPNNKVVPRKIKTSQAVGNQWLVSEGIAAGDKVIRDNLMKLKPGMVVKAIPREASAGVAKQK